MMTHILFNTKSKGILGFAVAFLATYNFLQINGLIKSLIELRFTMSHETLHIDGKVIMKEMLENGITKY